MNITLRQARRLEREIGVEQANVQSSISTHGVNVSIYEDFDASIESIQTSSVTALERAFQLGTLRASIRKAIETKNETAGLNKLINEEALLKERAKVLGAVMTSELTDKDLEITRQRHAQMKATGPSTTAYGGTQDTISVSSILRKSTLDLFKAQAKDIQRRLLKIVDELSGMNSTVTITISDEDLAFLEANSIIVS